MNGGNSVLVLPKGRLVGRLVGRDTSGWHCRPRDGEGRAQRKENNMWVKLNGEKNRRMSKELTNSDKCLPTIQGVNNFIEIPAGTIRQLFKQQLLYE